MVERHDAREDVVEGWVDCIIRYDTVGARQASPFLLRNSEGDS